FAALAETDSAATNGPDAFTAMMNRVAGIDFHSSLLTAHLLGWQAFGVRYALAQRRILLGDEMGLGKTLEALGVITARLAQGDTHALVVAPIGVLANWQREVAKHTMLTAYLIHGETAAWHSSITSNCGAYPPASSPSSTSWWPTRRRRSPTHEPSGRKR
ncbi:SNF2-related protein, partial [Lacticaseibacillus paracasei]|uniref:SNF2-related protein n=1 Tax=Lacticaseibacillus paracasei TaxID=1597 RepID=UPI000B218EC7